MLLAFHQLGLRHAVEVRLWLGSGVKLPGAEDLGALILQLGQMAEGKVFWDLSGNNASFRKPAVLDSGVRRLAEFKDHPLFIVVSQYSKLLR